MFDRDAVDHLAEDHEPEQRDQQRQQDADLGGRLLEAVEVPHEETGRAASGRTETRAKIVCAARRSPHRPLRTHNPSISGGPPGHEGKSRGIPGLAHRVTVPGRLGWGMVPG